MWELSLNGTAAIKERPLSPKRFLSSPFPPLFLDLTDRDRLRWKRRLLGEAPLYDVFAISPTYLFPFFSSLLYALGKCVSAGDPFSRRNNTMRREDCDGGGGGSQRCISANIKREKIALSCERGFPPRARKENKAWMGGSEVNGFSPRDVTVGIFLDSARTNPRTSLALSSTRHPLTPCANSIPLPLSE